jgi:hypothetical protein
VALRKFVQFGSKRLINAQNKLTKGSKRQQSQIPGPKMQWGRPAAGMEVVKALSGVPSNTANV